MARGQAEAASQNLALTNQQAAQSGQQAAQILGLELPVIQQRLASPGYDQATKDAIARAGMDTANSAFDAAGFSAANRAAATRNEAAGYGAADKLARDRAEAVSKAATGAQVQIGDAALKDRQQAIQDASQLYGINQDTERSLYGLGPGTLEARAASKPGPWGAIVGAAGTAALVA